MPYLACFELKRDRSNSNDPHSVNANHSESCLRDAAAVFEKRPTVLYIPINADTKIMGACAARQFAHAYLAANDSMNVVLSHIMYFTGNEIEAIKKIKFSQANLIEANKKLENLNSTDCNEALYLIEYSTCLSPSKLLFSYSENILLQNEAFYVNIDLMEKLKKEDEMYKKIIDILSTEKTPTPIYFVTSLAQIVYTGYTQDENLAEEVEKVLNEVSSTSTNPHKRCFSAELTQQQDNKATSSGAAFWSACESDSPRDNRTIKRKKSFLFETDSLRSPELSQSSSTQSSSPSC